MKLLHTLRLRPRLMAALGLGLVIALLSPLLLPQAQELSVSSRALLGWNTAVWLYLLMIARMMHKADAGLVQRVATRQADSAATMLGIVVMATLVSLAAIALELAGGRSSGAALNAHSGQNLTLAVSTVLGAWILLPVEFALAYASHFYAGHSKPAGLNFPSENENPTVAPDYLDFLYFSFTIAATAQTSDVAVTTRRMRSLVLLQALLSFAFNTVLLALTINLVAGLI